MATMTNPRTFGTAAESSSKPARSTFKYMLTNMLRACPREGARVITAQKIKRGRHGGCVWRTYHGHQTILVHQLGLRVCREIFGSIEKI